MKNVLLRTVLVLTSMQLMTFAAQAGSAGGGGGTGCRGKFMSVAAQVADDIDTRRAMHKPLSPDITGEAFLSYVNGNDIVSVNDNLKYKGSAVDVLFDDGKFKTRCDRLEKNPSDALKSLIAHEVFRKVDSLSGSIIKVEGDNYAWSRELYPQKENQLPLQIAYESANASWDFESEAAQSGNEGYHCIAQQDPNDKSSIYGPLSNFGFSLILESDIDKASVWGGLTCDDEGGDDTDSYNLDTGKTSDIVKVEVHNSNQGQRTISLKKPTSAFGVLFVKLSDGASGSEVYAKCLPGSSRNSVFNEPTYINTNACASRLDLHTKGLPLTSMPNLGE